MPVQVDSRRSHNGLIQLKSGFCAQVAEKNTLDLKASSLNVLFVCAIRSGFKFYFGLCSSLLVHEKVNDRNLIL